MSEKRTRGWAPQMMLKCQIISLSDRCLARLSSPPDSRTWRPCPSLAAEWTGQVGVSPSGAGRARARRLDYLSSLTPLPPMTTTTTTTSSLAMRSTPKSPCPPRVPPLPSPSASRKESAWSILLRRGWRCCWCGERGRVAGGQRASASSSSSSLMPTSSRRLLPLQHVRRRRHRRGRPP